MTKQCNLNCVYCFVIRDAKPSREIGTQALQKAIRSFLSLPGTEKRICFSGGEPTLRFEKIKKISEDILKSAKDNPDIKTTIVTNGTLLKKSHFDFFTKNRISVLVSVDGSAKTHDAQRPFAGKKRASSLNSLLYNLGKLNQNSIRDYGLTASLVFTPASVGHLMENIEFLRKAGFKQINFYHDLYSIWNNAQIRKLEKTFSGFAEYYVSMFKNAKNRQSVFENHLLHAYAKASGHYKPLVCENAHLDCSGTFYCCDKALSLKEEKRKKFSCGDVKTGLDNQKRLRTLDKIRTQMWGLTGKDCRTCKYVKYCFCPLGHYIYFSNSGKDFKEYFPQFCRISRIYIKTFLGIADSLKGNRLFSEIYSYK